MKVKKLAWLILAIAPFTHGAYDPEDTLKLNAELAYQYDDNVFRLADGENNSITLKHRQQGDAKIQASVGGRIDVPVSRQNFYAQANVSRQQYLNFEELNFNAWQAGLGWDWQAGSQLFGTLVADSSSSMNSFDDVRSGLVDMVRQNSVRWNGNWRIHSQWQLLADASYSEETHDQRRFEDAQSKIYGLGLQYATGKGSSITLRHQWQDYDYLSDLLFIPAAVRGYKEQMTTLGLVWPVTGQLSFKASAGLSRWESKFDGASSNSTPQGDVSAQWQVTGKTALRAGIAQNFDQFNGGVGRDLERSMYVGANWAMSEKMRWDTEYRYRQKETETSVGLILKDEQYNQVQLSLTYTPVTNVSVRSYARFEQRDDQLGRNDFDDTQLGLSGRYDF